MNTQSSLLELLCESCYHHTEIYIYIYIYIHILAFIYLCIGWKIALVRN